MSALWTIRPGRVARDDPEGDRAYVVTTWVRILGNLPQYQHLNLARYKRAVIEALVDRSTVLVAANAADPWHIVAVVVYEPEVVHWVSVVDRWRARGCGSGLLRAAGFEPTAGFDATHYNERAWRGRLHYRPSLLHRREDARPAA